MVELKLIIYAVAFGLVCAVGLAMILHQPPAVQVQVNQYQPLPKYTPVVTFTPAPPPVAAIPTVDPSSVVYNVNASNVKTGQFDPAPPPVVVTTLPIPTATPAVVSTQHVATQRGDACAISSSGNWNATGSTVCVLGTMTNAMSLTVVMVPFMMIMAIVMGFFRVGGGRNFLILGLITFVVFLQLGWQNIFIISTHT